MNDSPLRLVFAGTPDFAAAHLRALLGAGEHRIAAVYTQPDRPAGRGRKLLASPVKRLAEEAGLPVHQPRRLSGDAERQQLAVLNADLMVVVAYGLLLPQTVLDTPRLGCINVHASLLPRWRGAAPIQRAIEAGDAETGVTIMQMDAGLDTGDMLLKASCPVKADDTAASLHDRLAALGAEALVEALSGLKAGTLTAEPQDDSLSCYAPKIDKAEAEIDWQRSAVELERQVRAFNPFPVSYSFAGDERFKLWRAVPAPGGDGEPGEILAADSDGIRVACGEDSLLLQELQLPGARRLPVRDVLNARAALFAPGSRLGRRG